MMLRILVFSLFLLIPSLLQAQTISVPANTSFSIGWDHDGLSTNEYRVKINGAVVGTVLVGISPYSFDIVAGLPPGQNVVEIFAVNQFGETSGSTTFETSNPPSTSPTTITITITIAIP